MCIRVMGYSVGGDGSPSSFFALWNDVNVIDRRFVTFSRGIASRVADGIPTSMSSTLRRFGRALSLSPLLHGSYTHTTRQ